MTTFIWIATFCLLAGSVFPGQSVDDATLKRYLTQNFIADESMSWEKIDEFKERFAVTDEQLHRVLMGVYREAEGKRSTLTPKTREWNNNQRTIEGTLGWLPKCGAISVKDFLMTYAETKENDSWLRRSAVLSYLRAADAEETKNALLRFLVEGDRMSHMERLSIYEYARMVYDSASSEKQAAILAALIAAANREEGKIEFMKVDKILAERSEAYKRSRERLAMLKRHSLEPPTNNLYTDRDLKVALTEMSSLKSYVNISTNLSALRARDFNLPLPVGATNELMQTVSDSAPPESIKEGEKGGVNHRVGLIALLGGIAVILLGLGVWKFARK